MVITWLAAGGVEATADGFDAGETTAACPTGAVATGNEDETCCGTDVPAAVAGGDVVEMVGTVDDDVDGITTEAPPVIATGRESGPCCAHTTPTLKTEATDKGTTTAIRRRQWGERGIIFDVTTAASILGSVWAAEPPFGSRGGHTIIMDFLGCGVHDDK